MRITWSKEPHSTGLARIGEGPRGYYIKIDGENVGSVNPVCKDYVVIKWYWAVGSYEQFNMKHRNGVAEKIYFQTADEAKKACRAYIDQCLKDKS